MFPFAELRLARLALDPNNTPAWEVPEMDLKPATKMPLFVGDHCISSTHPKTDVSIMRFGIIFENLMGTSDIGHKEL